MVVLVASLARSKAIPRGSPDPPTVYTLLNVVPPLVLRQMPSSLQTKLSEMLTDVTMVAPRGAIPEKPRLVKVPPPVIGVQLAPPSVVLSKPVRLPPFEENEL